MCFREPLVKYLISFAMAVAAALSGYYAAYTGLRVGLATKAEEHYVSELDIRLARLETLIDERFATKRDMAEFKNEVVARLSAIEAKMKDGRK